jgi:replicative superfamily II helicase
MNANELAEWLDCNCAEVPIKKWVNDIPVNEMTNCADMLRRQQAEIKALREQLKYLETQVYGGITK